MKDINQENRRTFIKTVGAAALMTSAVSGNAFAKGQSSALTNSKVKFDDIPRMPLTTLPTALNKMNNLTRELNGPDLYIKRDDVMELAHGGNKTRKLEFALAAARNEGADCVITTGGVQSNHVRQTVSGCAKTGFESHVVLSVPAPEKKKQHMSSGNYLMDVIMGAHIYIADTDRPALIEKVRTDLIAAGKKPYMIPAGASNGIGSLGYMVAARELIAQWAEMNINPSHVFIATGSCGTQSGLLMGLRYFGNTTTKVVGVSVGAPAAAVEARTRVVLNQICDVIDVDKGFIKDEDIIVKDEYFGQAYAYPTQEGLDAIKLVGSIEGILLDPVYTGKAMSGYIDMVRNNKLENAKDVVFLHTGGAPAIHPYADLFLS